MQRQMDQVKAKMGDTVNFEKEKSRLLTQPVLTIGDKTLSGLALLQLTDELSKQDSGEWHSGSGRFGSVMTGTMSLFLMLGIPFFFKSFRRDLARSFEPIFHTSKFQELFYAPDEDIDSKVSEALQKFEDFGWIRQGEGSGYWHLTEMGRHLIEKQPKLASLSQQVISLTPETEKASAKPISQDNIRFSRVKALITGNRDGKRGWEVLKTLEALQENQSFLKRLRGHSLPMEKIVQALTIHDEEGFQRQLEELSTLGFLKKSGAPDTISWRLTEAGHLTVKAGDPLKTNQVSEQDMQRILQSHIDTLSAEKQIKEQQLTQLEAEHTKAQHSLIKKQDEVQTLAADLTSQAENQAQPVHKKQLQLENERKQIRLLTEWTAQLKLKTDAAKVSLSAWHRQTQQTIEELNQAKIQLQTARVNRSISEMFKSLQAIEERQRIGNEALDRQLHPLLDEIEGDYHQSASRLEVEKTAESLKASQQIESTLAAMAAEAEKPEAASLKTLTKKA